MYDKRSPSYFARHWRNTPQQTIEVFEEFLDWYKDEIINPYATEQEEKEEQAKIKALRGAVNKFLEYDPEKVNKGEAEMLQKWIKANGNNSLPK